MWSVLIVHLLFWIPLLVLIVLALIYVSKKWSDFI